MASNKYLAKGLKRSALTVALGLCFAGSVQAQSTTGTIYGDAGAGATVTARNQAGVTRTVTADAAGRYSIGSLPTGEYTVTIESGGQVVGTGNVTVLAGAGADAGATTLGTVTVVGSGALSTIDVTTVESKLVLTKETLDKLPIAQNLTAISLLAPGVVQGDSRYGNVPAFMGSSASENAYYINGFPVTQSLTQFGYSELPFNAVDQIQVSTGGYSVEYGRATGGVVSVITSSGSNEWKFGGQYIIRPESLLSDPKNIFYGPDNQRSGLAFGNANQIFQYRQDNKFERQTLSAYASGPIFKDRLFFFAAGEFVDVEGGGVSSAASTTGAVTNARRNGWTDSHVQTPRWLGKIDWNITDNHLLSVTALQDRTFEHDDRSGFDYTTFSRVGDVVSGYDRDRSTRAYIGNYVGYLTDDLTVTAMVGESKTEYEGGPVGFNPDCPTITLNVGSQAPGLNYPTCQLSGAPGYLPGRFDKTEAWRLDVEYRLGDHTVKVGYDSNEATSLVGSANDGINYPGALGVSFAGGFQWAYFRATNPNEPIYPLTGVGSPASGGGLGTQGFYVIRNVGSNISTPRAVQEAQYIKDLWQVTDNVLVELGLRNEQFTNYNSAGVAYISKNWQPAPRVGVTWDVNGDSTTKLYASLGRYHLAVPNNVSRRGADSATNTSEAFTYTGVDPTTGAPTGLKALGPVYSPNGEFGEPRDARSFAPTSLKSHFQDTFAMGAEQNFGSFNAGAKFTYANLGSAIDDFCDDRQVGQLLQGKYTTAQIQGVMDFFHNCVLLNPGEDNTYQYDIDGNGTYEEIVLTKEMLKFPELKRRYKELGLFVERPFDGKWYGRMDYTWSKSIGNIEGQLNSDIGQIDVSTTLTGDYFELSEHSYGYLPNDRRHQFKANGFWQVFEELTLSGNVSYASGRPMNCRGAYPATPVDPTRPNYGSFHFYCDGVPAPRGTFGRLPSTVRLDLGARYAPNWVPGLAFGVNIHNVLDRQSVQNVQELYNQGQSRVTRNANWGRVQSYTAPRYVEFSVRYDFKAGK